MTEPRSHRVLVVTDAAEPTKSLRDAIRHRAENGEKKQKKKIKKTKNKKEN